VAFLESVSSLKARVALTTAYAAGLRVSEVAVLKVSDIDSSRMVMRIEHGKGGKERTAMLSAPLLDILRSYWRLARPAAVSVSWSKLGQADRTDRFARRLPFGGRRGGARQAGQRACAATQLRHPPSGERRRHPHHSGSARSREPVDDGALYARLDATHRQYRQSPRSALSERDAARIRGDGAAGVRTGRRLPPPRRRLRRGERRTSRARRTARDQGDHGLPHGGAWRSCRALRGLRPHPHRLQLVPQSPLSKMPGRGAHGMACSAAGRTAAGPLYQRS